MKQEKDTEEKVEKGKFLGRFVIEILGKPKDHIQETMKNYVEKLKQDEKLEFVNEFIAEPEEKDNAYAIYSELEIWIDGMEKLFAFCLDAMPSSVEILEPSEFIIKSSTFTSMLNDLQAKMHEVDLAVKTLRFRKKKLESNASSILQNFIMWLVKENAKTPEQLKIETGVNEEALKPYLDTMVQEGRLELIDERWYGIKNKK